MFRIKNTGLADEAILTHGRDCSLLSLSAMQIVIVFACMQLIATTGFLLGLSVIWASLPLSFIISILVLYFAAERDLVKLLCSSAICIGVFIVACLAAGCVYSVDYDGNSYHKMAIGLLKNGWNPFQESSADFCHELLLDYQQNYIWCSIWIDHYAKATWFISSGIYALTGNIECGKAYNLLASYSLLGLVFPYLLEKLKGRKIAALAVSLILVFNPVSLCQLFSYYIDGFMATYYFLLLVGLTQMLDEESGYTGRWAWLLVCSSMVVLGNVKFTGLLYGGLLCILFFILVFIRGLRQKNSRAVLRTFLAFVLLAIVVVCYAGATTYILNALQHGNPVYPLAGEGKIDIMTTNSPRGFEGAPIWEKLIYGLFGEMQNLQYTGEESLPNLKVPFSVTYKELENVLSICFDMRISGFGVLFSGIFIVSIISILVFSFIFIRKGNQQQRKLGMYCLVLSAFSILLLIAVSESWWARYTPFLYILPVFSLVLFFTSEGKLSHILGLLMVVLLFVNNLLFCVPVIKMIAASKTVSDELNLLEGNTIEIQYVDAAEGVAFNLLDHEIKYELLDSDEQFSESSPLFYGKLKYRIVQ